MSEFGVWESAGPGVVGALLESATPVFQPEPHSQAAISHDGRGRAGPLGPGHSRFGDHLVSGRAVGPGSSLKARSPSDLGTGALSDNVDRGPDNQPIHAGSPREESRIGVAESQ